MACAAYLQDLANSIWVDLGSPTDLSPAAIQSKLTSAAFLGKLNTLIDTCYILDDSGNIVPDLGLEEQAIYQLMYEVDYYTGKINNTLNGYGTAFISLQDGDSRIVKSDIVNVARLYRDQQAQLYRELGMLVGSYRSDGAQPSSVDMYTIIYGGVGATNSPGVRGYYRS